MGRRNPIAVDIVEARLKAVHGTVLSLDRSTYVGVGKKATFTDIDHGQWEAYVSNVLAGHCHPIRGKRHSHLTNAERYGSATPLGSATIRRKIEVTNLGRYGSKNVLGRGSIVRETAKHTFQERYGVENAQQIPEVRDRSARTRRTATVIRHWKTGIELTCVGSYEVAVVNWLNANGIDFLWQVPIKIPSDAPSDVAGRTYFIDMQVTNGEHAGKYVEIKGGWPRELQRKKWEWFHGCHTSELWTSDVLKRLGITGKR